MLTVYVNWDEKVILSAEDYEADVEKTAEEIYYSSVDDFAEWVYESGELASLLSSLNEGTGDKKYDFLVTKYFDECRTHAYEKMEEIYEPYVL